MENPDLGFNLPFLLLLNFQEKRSVDVGKHASKGNRRANQGVEFLVATDRELQVARCDTLDLQVFGGVASKFQDFCSKVFKDSGYVNSS